MEYKIPVEWSVYGTVNIEADTLEEAVKIAFETADDIPLPEGDYIDGSFIICSESRVNKYEDLEEEDFDYYRMFN